MRQLKKSRLELLCHAICLGISIILLAPASTFSQAPFYEGKTITMIRSSGVGSVGDLRTRALVPYLRKYIPGTPTIIIEYMPGGGGRKATNYLYASASPDGLTMATISSSVVANAILGASGVMYDIDKLIFVGAPMIGSPWVFVTRNEPTFNGLEKLSSASGLRVGGQTVGHATHIVARIFAYFIGPKDSRFVTGYRGPELDAALIRGEIDARAKNADPALKRYADWIEKGLVKFHAFLEITKGQVRDPFFADLPELENFAKSSKERRLLAMYRAISLVGTALVLPPGTSTERVEIVRAAMRKALKDPGFHKKYKTLVGEDAVPLMPEEQQRAINELPREPEIVNLMKQLAGPGPLPAR